MRFFYWFLKESWDMEFVMTIERLFHEIGPA